MLDIQTSIGAATLADLNHHPHHPVSFESTWGPIFWGRCDRVTFGTIVCNSKAAWIADCDYSSTEKITIVIFSTRKDVKIGDRVEFDKTPTDAICPDCGSPQYVSSGVNWRCKNCDCQWRKLPQKRGRPKKCIK